MARDKIVVDLDLDSRRAQRQVAALQKKIDGLSKSMGGAMRGIGGGGGGDKVRALGTGLSKATVRADEFTKSLEASNARVIAFGASAGLIMQVDRALKAMVQSAVKVEKAMMDVNVVMNVSVKTLDQFGKGMFKVARETAQSFDTVAEAATELARQGLGMEKTLQRTKDALILTRLTGMNAADSVKSLTAAVNSFNKEGATSAKIVNTMAKVDAAYAVSSEDLAKAIGRVGASAQSAGVNMNELMAITTAVQQRTARGGAVIGNAFKTIFTRIQRSDVQKKLRDFGIASTDMQGRMLNGMKVLDNMAKGFDNLTKAQQASLAENVAGVFQVNILKAALSDLSQETSNYRGSLKAANSATDEAYRRNEQLNQTLDALANRTMANLTKAGASMGGGMFEPAIRKVLNSVNTTIEAFGEGGKMEGAGETIGKGLMAGIGNFISGPGIVMVLAGVTKLALNLGKFASTAMKDFMGLNRAAQQRAGLEEMVIEKLKSEPQYIQQIISKEKTLVQVQREMLMVMEAQTLERTQQQVIARQVATGMYSRGARVTPAGNAAFIGPTKPGKAGGFVPNFANAGAERAAASAGGYNAGAIKTMRQPGIGSMTYNSAETVKQFPGMSQSAIMPPKNSPAGAGYKSAFNAAHGFNPYAAGGFVPNFVKPLQGSGIGVALGFQGSSAAPEFYSQPVKHLTALKKIIKPKFQNEQIRLSGVKSKAIFQPGERDRDAEKMFSSSLDEATRRALSSTAGSIVKQLDIDGKPLGQDDLSRVQNDAFTRPLHLPESFEGQLFEEGLRIAVKGSRVSDTTASFDFEANKKPSRLMQALFDAPKDRIDAKRQQSTANNIVNKFLNDGLSVGGNAPFLGSTPEQAFASLNTGVRQGKIGSLQGFLKQAMGVKETRKAFPKKMGAMGFVPNFSPVTSAIGREMSAGVPASAIRVGSSPALRSAGNPGGVGVYNTIDEPGGLGQGVSRARRSGMNPKAHGAAGGFIPNFNLLDNKGFTDAFYGDSPAKDMKDAGKDQLSAADKNERAANRIMMASMMFSMIGPGAAAGMGAAPSTQAAIGAGSNILAMAGMGASFGMGGGAPGIALGALGGAAVGALTSMGDLKMGFGEEGRRADSQQALDNANAVSEGLAKVTSAISALSEAPFQNSEDRIKTFTGLSKALDEVQESLLKGGEGTAGSLDSFLKARGSMGSVSDFAKMSPEKQKSFLKKTDVLISEARESAQATLTGGTRSSYDRQIGTISGAALTSTFSAGAYGRRQMGDAQAKREKLQADLTVGGGVRSAFTSGFQDKLANLPALMGPGGIPDTGTSGKVMIERYTQQMKRGEGRAAMGTLTSLLERGGDRGKFMAQDLRAALGRKDPFENPVSGYESARNKNEGRFTDEDIIRGAGSGVDQSVGRFEYQARSAFGVMQMIERGRERNMLPLFDPRITDDPKQKGETPEQKASREELERLSKTALTPLIKSGAAMGRRAGYDMSFNVGRNNRNLGVRGAGRTSRIAQNAAGNLFGVDLIQANKAISEEGLMDTYQTSLANTEATRTGTVTKSRSDAFAAYNAALQKRKMGADERNAAALQMYALDGASIEELERQRDTITTSPKPTGADSDLLAYLNKVIKDETLADEARDESRRKANDELDTNTQKLNANTLSQEKILEASKKFYSGKYFDNLKTERSVLEGRIEMEAQLVKEGKLNIEVLEESKLKFEELNEKLDGTGNKLAVLEGAFDRLLTDGLTREQRKDAVVNAQNSLNAQVGGRMSSGAGAAGIISNAQKAFNAGQIGAGELRAIKANARTNAPGATGNPMEAFRDQFMYGGRDQMLEFENGVVGVANTMKSSFADAFKSISSGASTGKEAIVAFADSILNSISNVSANMATNMLFSKMFSGGGQVSRFAGGGLVTGGSGVRDDVPALMSGGEYVIKKSSVNKIGVGTLNAINGYASGGSTGGQQGGDFSAMNVAKLYGISAAASLASGAINQPPQADKITQQNYGQGRSNLGYLGGADPDAGGVDAIRGGGRSAGVSLNKAFVYYRRDPVTGQLVSERARPTEGRFETSSLISTMGLLREDDPQTARMFSKEEKMAGYQDYLATEKSRRSDVMKAHNRQKRGRLMSAYVNAAMLVGGQALMGGAGDLQGSVHSRAKDAKAAAGNPNFSLGHPENPHARGGAIPSFAEGGRVSPAMLMGGEYVMSPDSVRTYGANFMSELNRGNAPGMANGGLVGGAAPAGAGISTNNVKININIDKSGNAEVGSSLEASQGDNADDRDINNEVENNRKMAEMLQGVVLKTIVDQQRPGGLLQDSN